MSKWRGDVANQQHKETCWPHTGAMRDSNEKLNIERIVNPATANLMQQPFVQVALPIVALMLAGWLQNSKSVQLSSANLFPPRAIIPEWPVRGSSS
jgi:hypothetical protein